MKLRPLLVVVAALALLLATGAPSSPDRGLHVVLLDGQPLAAYEGGVAGLAATDPEVTGQARLDVDSAASRAYLAYLSSRHDEFLAQAGAALGRSFTARFHYDAVLNGVAVELSTSEAAAVAGMPGVERVVADFARELLTDAGPSWIGAPAIWNGSGTGGLPGTKGEGVVVGVIDTGINHDHPSFADVGGDGFDHTNPRGRFFGVCDPVTGAPFCNDKLIGAWDFTGTTPEDTHLHGSHTASTAAGNVLDAEIIAPTITLERRISGVAPHANLITYKACPQINCLLTALLASINQATLDEVDVVNYSIGGASADPWSDLDAVAFRNARNAGIFVSASAGNTGPGAATVGSPSDAPWVMSVGASTHNRDFPNSLVSMSGGGSAPPADIRGKGVTSGYGPAPIVYAGDYGFPLCGDGPAAPTGEAAINPFPPGTFNGEIVVCDRGVYGRVEKGQNVKEGGAGGYVLANDELNGDSLVGDAHALPGVHISFAKGNEVKAWLATGSGHMATISGMSTDETFANGDVMASFSSRGPNPSVPDVVKPDVTAPGVDILAAFNTTNPTAPPEFGIISGTSMSSPHNAGSAALLRALHPTWTPDQVRSALVTTGFTTLPGTGNEQHGVLKENGATPADAFDLGGGRVDLRSAGRAGLLLDETSSDYEAANPASGGDPATLNLPTLGQDDCAGTCSWTRVVTSSASVPVTWSAASMAPPDVALSTSPSSFTLAPGASQTLTITADVRASAGSGWHFGQVVLVPDVSTIPDAHLTVAANKTAGGGVERIALHFHGNGHDDCSGIGQADLPDCPFLSPDATPDSEPAAAFGPVTTGLNCTVDQCIADPNWIWRLDGPTTIGGPMTVEWWVQCPPCNAALADDFFIRLWVDGVKVFEARVRHNNLVPGAATMRLRDTVTVPQIVANEKVVLQVDPIFLNQNSSIFYYDSTQACPGALNGPCDSVVHVPVVVPQRPDLVVQDASASNARPREGVPVRISATVANTGNADAAASTTRFVLDGTTELGAVATPALEPGQTAQVSVDWDTRGVKGQHTITISADGAGVVAESDEGNNDATLTITVKGNKVQNGSFQQSSGGSPDHWTASGDTSYDGESASAGPTGSWTSDPIAVVPGTSYDVVVSATGSLGTVVVQQLSAAGLIVGSVSLPALGLLDTPVSVGADAAQLRIVLQGGVTGTTFDDVGLFER